MQPLDRRRFLSESAFLAAAAAAAPAIGSLSAEEKAAAKKPGSASDKLRVAVVGVRGQGMSHVRGYAARHNCVVTTVCDVDKAVIGPAMKHIEKEQGKAPTYEQDIRKVVADKDIDVISIATPNHWHALAAIWAMQNGKDVYVEKPVSHNVSEGRRMVETARRYDKICQTGTQSRSTEGMQAAMAFIHGGKIGKVKLARGLCYKLRDSIGKVKGPQQPPSSMDYDLWCGPAPADLPRRKNVHYDWHWIWAYGNGDLGNQGIHEMDKARWGLKKDGLPKSVMSVGGRLGYTDDGQTPNTQIIEFDYGDCELVFEVRGLSSDSPYPGKKSPKRGVKRTAFVGNVWYGSEGFVVCPSYNGGVAYSNDGEILAEFSGGGDHFGNFIKAVRSRKKADLNADILEGHLSSALCHLGNISYRVGKQEILPAGKVFGEKAADDAVKSMVDHLGQHKVSTTDTPVTIGKKLTLAGEKFVGDKEADAMLTREYRAGFVVPEKV
jgi:predicted dehydrogenase